ncbi:MAG TPA: thioredoxin domain-containing protein [bacterium]|nr:thioredoxin domain-containing protein [bacterium]
MTGNTVFAQTPAAQDGKANKLITEKSPYLLQHAHNPVNWYPWGNEAFKKASDENKPVFLSIGYSTCHWCHVMAHESFEDPATAEILNENFISIKVDREERPDIDAAYMAVCQAMTGSGGWPLTIIMTPDRKPFFAGTYFPPEDRQGMRGFKTVLAQIVRLWKEENPRVLESAESISQLFDKETKDAAGKSIDESIMTKAAGAFASMYDEEYGGFAGAGTKFPMSHNLSMLLRHWKRSGDVKSLEIVKHTLEMMSGGGIHDHLGGGFARYSTDRKWLVPHFEKMLYDQAITARAYLETYQATGDLKYADTARDIFDYVIRDLTDENGAFYSAEDADSEGEEGRFYVWTKEEISGALGSDAALFNEYFGVTDEGNFEGKNILNIRVPADAFAASHDINLYEFESTIKRNKAALLEIRNKRIRPHLDDKILASWNGLMISALAYGAKVLDEPRYANAASGAADFILAGMFKDGVLYRRYRNGETAIPGFLDDYAFFAAGLLDLYEAEFDLDRLEQAKTIADVMTEKFRINDSGAFMFSSEQADELPGNIIEGHDGALPSGNSIAALVLLKLQRYTMDMGYGAKADEIFRHFSAGIMQQPTAFSQMLSAYDFSLSPSTEIVIKGETGDPVAQDMIRLVNSLFLPGSILVFYPADQTGERIEQLIPLTEFKEMKNGMPTAFVCKDFSCKFPTTDIWQLRDLLTGGS